MPERWTPWNDDLARRDQEDNRRETWYLQGLRDGYLTYQGDPLLVAVLEVMGKAHAHISELRTAWRLGTITEHDGLGGERSNRNHELQLELQAALRAFKERHGTA